MDKTDRAASINQSIVYPYQSVRTLAIDKLQARHKWNEVRYRTRWICCSPSALTAGAHPE